jgi:serine/threonine protein kinase/Flp pilus assembly protein TadD
LIGQTIKHFRIIDKLGEGGMGIVYLAKDTNLNRNVAIKMLPSRMLADDEQLRRFRNEAQTAAALNHPNIAQIYAIEQEEDNLFIVMEAVAGNDLAVHLKDNQLTPTAALKIALQLADGLGAAQEKGIVHRDIKPSNLLIDPENRLKITDFGLAKLDQASAVTKAGTTLGTIAYMAPELLSGGQADWRSDIWSFGVVLYEILTGKRPFEGLYEQAIMYAVLHDDPQPPQSIQPEIPPLLVKLVQKCLHKDPEQRYQSFAEISNVLRTILTNEDEDFTFKPHTMVVNLPATPAPRKPMKYALIGFAAVLLLVMSFYLGGFSRNWFEAPLPDQQRLFVLPLNNIGNDPQHQPFCDGLHEILTGKLSQLQKNHTSLWVVPAAEVRKFGVASPSDGHDVFDANLAITGSLQAINNLYRITLNLIDARDLRQLNSKTLDLEADNIFSLQDLAVSTLFEMLSIQLNANDRQTLKAGTTELSEAYKLYVQGKGLLAEVNNTDNIIKAIALFTRAIALDSNYTLAYTGLGKAHWQQFEQSNNPTDAQKAIRFTNIAYSKDKAAPEASYMRGVIANGRGQYDEAVKAFKRVIGIDPYNSDAFRGLARAYIALNLPEEAERTYKKAIEIRPDYWISYNDLGVHYFRRGELDKAVVQFAKVTELAPKYFRGYNNLGGIYYYQKRYEDARNMFNRSYALNKDYSVASNLGSLYFIKGNYSKAVDMYREAIELNPKDYVLWGNLAGAMFWRDGKKDAAMAQYQKAIQMAEELAVVTPNNADILSNLAQYHSMLNQGDKARNLIQKALLNAPDDQQIQFRAAAVYEQLQQRDLALQWIEKAIANGFPRTDVYLQPDLQGLVKDPRFPKEK